MYEELSSKETQTEIHEFKETLFEHEYEHQWERLMDMEFQR